MLLLPADILAFVAPFAPLFSRPVWRHMQVLLVSDILAPGRRRGHLNGGSLAESSGLGAAPRTNGYTRTPATLASRTASGSGPGGGCVRSTPSVSSTCCRIQRSKGWSEVAKWWKACATSPSK